MQNPQENPSASKAEEYWLRWFPNAAPVTQALGLSLGGLALVVLMGLFLKKMFLIYAALRLFTAPALLYIYLARAGSPIA
ncbi:MAG: hypothetical protein K2Q01_08730, partial [Rickettsiales bacterium]|nr:hypothetical protein [Rickettsiales bacterium]